MWALWTLNATPYTPNPMWYFGPSGKLDKRRNPEWATPAGPVTRLVEWESRGGRRMHCLGPNPIASTRYASCRHLLKTLGVLGFIKEPLGKAPYGEDCHRYGTVSGS